MQDFKPRQGRPKKTSAPRRPRQVRPQPGAGLGLKSPGSGVTANRRSVPRPPLGSVLASAGSLMHRLAFAAVLGWLVVGLAQGGAEMWRSPLRHVDVVGNRTLGAAEVVAAAGLEGGMAMGRVDPYTVARRLAALPRIAAADVRRRFPGRVDISLTERTAAAVLEEEGRPPRLVDEAGVLLGEIRPGDPAAAGLPLLRFREPPAPERVVWGLETARAVRRLRIAKGGAFALELDNPFAPVLVLPKKHRRVILPPQAALPALQTLRNLHLPRPGGPEAWQTLDFRTMAPDDGGRIIITG